MKLKITYRQNLMSSLSGIKYYNVEVYSVKIVFVISTVFIISE